MDLESWGQLGLFISSYLAATFFPVGCEAIFVALLSSAKGFSDGMFHFTILNATVGNTLGGLTTYIIGQHVPLNKALQFFKISEKRLKQSQTFVLRYSKWMAFFTWLPILGDPIALCLGHYRVNILLVFLMMIIGKFIRFFLLGILGLFLFN